MKSSWVLPLVATAACLAAAAPAPTGESKLVDAMHAYYVKQFDNLAGVKDGKFGTARIESSQIEHIRATEETPATTPKASRPLSKSTAPMASL